MSTSSKRKAKMIMILSPAKTLDMTRPAVSATTQRVTTTLPESCHVPHKTREIATCLKAKTCSELAKLLGLSKTLAQTSWQYWNDFVLPDPPASNNDNDDDGTQPEDINTTTTKPSIFFFSGAAYQGLEASSLENKDVEYLQDHLRIVDPLYGLLRPLDVMQPYRLEMATKGLVLSSNEPINGGEDEKETAVVKLADYWKAAVTKSLLQDLTCSSSTSDSSPGILLNLASEEYSAAVDTAQLVSQHHVVVVKVVFRENGRVVSVHAKRARGLMVRYVATTRSETLEQIQQFQFEGYKFVPGESNETTLVFDRPKNWKSKEAEESDTQKKGDTHSSKKRGRQSSKVAATKKRKK